MICFSTPLSTCSLSGKGGAEVDIGYSMIGVEFTGYFYFSFLVFWFWRDVPSKFLLGYRESSSELSYS